MSVALYKKTPENTTHIPDTLIKFNSSPNTVTPTRIVIISFKTPPIIKTIAFDFRINQNSHKIIAIAMQAPVSPNEIVFIPLSNVEKKSPLLGPSFAHGCSIVHESKIMKTNIEDERTLIVATEPFNGGSNLCSLNCTSVHRIPLSIAATRTITNPTASNSTSPNAVSSSPSIINTPTVIRLHDTFSMPKKKALASTHIGLDDFTIVKKVIDILTRDKFDNPTSTAVTNPQGIVTPM
mmetsp:Transcript_27266/g.57370  ORF Transcript_27266/g.57370 Transcript_27266/m.57370 type:complete len:237 (+) Transcript_27266:403-1113(+)